VVAASASFAGRTARRVHYPPVCLLGGDQFNNDDEDVTPGSAVGTFLIGGVRGVLLPCFRIPFCVSTCTHVARGLNARGELSRGRYP
jgi:hypothetical protein